MAAHCETAKALNLGDGHEQAACLHGVGCELDGQEQAVPERFRYKPYGQVAVAEEADAGSGADGHAWHCLHEGLRADGGTSALHRFRNHDFSPRPGRWAQQDPMGYVDGMSLYEYVRSGPTIHVDPTGLLPPDFQGARPTPIADRDPQQRYSDLLWGTEERWRSKGWTFAADLLDAFLSGRYQSGDAACSFNQHADKIKSDPKYRKAADRYWYKWVDNHKPGIYELGAVSNAFHVGYYGFDEDLEYALGGAHFGYYSARVEICDGGFGHGKDYNVEAHMFQRDYYTFAPVGPLGYRLMFPEYEAAHNLQKMGFGTPFWHSESWQDEFSSHIDGLFENW